jgi:fumarylacetoacetase
MLASGDPRRERIEPALLPRAAVDMLLPARIGNFTDFFSSMYHAQNAGGLFRPDRPLFPNYKYVPVAYHGRASSIRASGGQVKRPSGQIVERGGPPAPVYRPSGQLDFEAELGMLIGTPTALGEPVPIGEARRHVFGMCIVNDWSARDIQAWEAQPLGPFLGKSFATTISPWVVTMEALKPFRIPVFERAADDPAPLPHLWDDEDQALGGVSIAIETRILTPKMVADGASAVRISAGTLADSYWSPAQMIAHHTSNGCNLEIGDLIATGTVSGPDPESWGSLLEKTAGGRNAINLGNGENRTYLLNGDEIILSARCEKPGYRRIGFGECRGGIVA